MGYLCNAESAIVTCDSYNYKLRKKKTHHHNDTIKLRKFTYSELEAATNGFSPRNLLGKGSHGAVYRAVLDGGKLTAAVKKFTASAGITSLTSENNELEILSKIRSRRIVNLIGYAVGSAQRKLLLVVEHMPNGSLYDFIHKNINKPPGWLTRIRFSLQIAKAVRGLHGSNPPIIHRDIKSSNILIDDKGNTRLSDFGLALRGHVEEVRVTKTPPAGTLGYLDPSYLAPSDVSTKSDIFSFGILLLEIVSGRRAIDVNYSPPSVTDWALPLIKSGNYNLICDRRIGGPADPTVIRGLALLAFRCVRSTAEKRPCGEEVVHCLKKIYKRAKEVQVPIWNNLRRRVRGTERSWPLDWLSDDGVEEKERAARGSRHGSRRSLSGRNSRKVSNVPSTENSVDQISQVVPRGRSRSIGSFREIKEVDKRRPQVVVKMSTVKLSKSRSMNVLSSSKVVNIHRSNTSRAPQVKELDVFPLLVNSGDKCERESPKL